MRSSQTGYHNWDIRTDEHQLASEAKWIRTRLVDHLEVEGPFLGRTHYGLENDAEKFMDWTEQSFRHGDDKARWQPTDRSFFRVNASGQSSHLNFFWFFP